MVKFVIHTTDSKGTVQMLYPANSTEFIAQCEDCAYKVLSGELRCFTPYLI